MPGYRAAHSPRDRQGEAGFRREKIKNKVAFRTTGLHTSLDQAGGVIALSVKPILDKDRFAESKTQNIILSLISGLIGGGIPFYFIASALNAPDPLRRGGSSLFIALVGIAVFLLLVRRLRTTAVNLEVQGDRVTDRDSSASYPKEKCSVQLDENVLGAFFYLGEEVISTSYLGQDDFGVIEKFASQAGLKTERITFDADRAEPI